MAKGKGTQALGWMTTHFGTQSRGICHQVVRDPGGKMAILKSGWQPTVLPMGNGKYNAVLMQYYSAPGPHETVEQSIKQTKKMFEELPKKFSKKSGDTIEFLCKGTVIYRDDADKFAKDFAQGKARPGPNQVEPGHLAVLDNEKTGTTFLSHTPDGENSAEEVMENMAKQAHNGKTKTVNFALLVPSEAFKDFVHKVNEFKGYPIEYNVAPQAQLECNCSTAVQLALLGRQLDTIEPARTAAALFLHAAVELGSTPEEIEHIKAELKKMGIDSTFQERLESEDQAKNGLPLIEVVKPDAVVEATPPPGAAPEAPPTKGM